MSLFLIEREALWLGLDREQSTTYGTVTFE